MSMFGTDERSAPRNREGGIPYGRRASITAASTHFPSDHSQIREVGELHRVLIPVLLVTVGGPLTLSGPNSARAQSAGRPPPALRLALVLPANIDVFFRCCG
jgi:hypothetical protein